MRGRKKLILLRHASAELTASSDDRSRRLTPRGVAEAVSIGKAISAKKEQGWNPGQIFSSDATRARQTLEGLKKGLNYRGKEALKRNFYSCGPREVLEISMEASEDTDCLLLLGHNPVWSELVGYLSGESRALSPANAVLLTCDADTWAEALAPTRWLLEHFLTPEPA